MRTIICRKENEGVPTDDNVAEILAAIKSTFSNTT